LHVGIIMDGNGRWAEARGRSRIAGHRAGGDTVRRIVECAPDHGIATLTLYAFSADNWRRPRREVTALMGLLVEYLRGEIARCMREGVRLSFIGRRDRLPGALLAAMKAGESATARGRTLHLRVAIDYSARDAIVRAAGQVARERTPLPDDAGIDREAFARALAGIEVAGAEAPDVDLLIRTGGEQRLSDFLLWECAYAELHFTEVMWPDFGIHDLEGALREFHGRQRRFGGLSQQAAG
jgi:undecaprenyl diphosphate synthase